MLLREKVSIVTGAGRGIGRAIARLFAAEGSAVVIASRTKSQLDSLAAEIRKGGGCVEAVATDLSTEEGCAQVVRAARDKFAGVDILVNNAGIYGPVKPIEELNPAEWDAVMNINLRTAFLMTRFVLPDLYSRGGGSIVNISSISAKDAYAWGAAYSTSKAGLLGLTRVTAAEGAKRGVRANAICPGPVPETEMSQELGRGLAARTGRTPEEVLQFAVSGILQGRPQTANEVAEVALFLASDQASAITAQALNVDGGTLFY